MPFNTPPGTINCEGSPFFPPGNGVILVNEVSSHITATDSEREVSSLQVHAKILSEVINELKKRKSYPRSLPETPAEFSFTHPFFVVLQGLYIKIMP